MSKVAARPVCNVCKRRQAVYYRRLSGDLLCSRCLERQMYRTVKKTLSRSRTLKPKQQVLLWLSPADPWGSAALAMILPEIEASQASRVVVASTDAIDIRGLDDLEINIVSRGREVYRQTVDINTCIRVDRALAGMIAEDLGVSVIILPYTRDTLTMAAVDAVTRGPWAVSEAAEKLEATGRVYVSGMAGVEAEAAAAYSFLNSLKPRTEVRCHTPVKGIVYSIAPGRPELVYSSSKTTQLFLDAARDMLESNMMQCRVCGGYTTNKESICNVCRRLTGGREHAGHE